MKAVVQIPDITTTESHGINDGSETVLKRGRSDFTTALLPSTDGVSDLSTIPTREFQSLLRPNPRTCRNCSNRSRWAIGNR